MTGVGDGGAVEVANEGRTAAGRAGDKVGVPPRHGGEFGAVGWPDGEGRGKRIHESTTVYRAFMSPESHPAVMSRSGKIHVSR
jgi:hypothetical protein